MGERKVINKYFPPDFDPTKIPRQKGGNINPNFVVRMMLPMSVRCLTCGEYMYKGKKFNSRKEDVEGPDGQYLGIQRFRFYQKCVTCSAEFTFTTDPKNSDYAAEAGIQRNYEPHKDVEAQKKAALDAREASDKDDAMMALENKTKDSKVEMDILDALDEIRTQNNRNASIKVDDVIAQHRQQSAQLAAEASTSRRKTIVDEEEELAVREFAAARTKRLRDDSDEDSALTSSGVYSRHEMGDVGSSTCAEGPSVASVAGRSCSSTKLTAAKKAKLPVGLIVQTKSTLQEPKKALAPPALAPVPSTALEGTISAAASGEGGVGDSQSSGGDLLGLGAYDSNSSNSD